MKTMVVPASEASARGARPIARWLRRFVAATTMVWLGSSLGCGVGQSESCQRYLACQAYYDDLYQRQSPNTNPYQPEGVCWETDELADACNVTCLDRIENLQDRLNEEEVDVGECG